MPRASKSGVRGLYKTAEGWDVDLRWRDPRTGKFERYRQRLPKSTNAATAKVHARALLNAALAGTFDAYRKPMATLRTALDEYGKVLDSSFPKYAKKRRGALKRLLSGIGDKGLDQVSALDVERFKRARKIGADGKPRKPATVNRDLEILKTFFRWSVTAFNLPDSIVKGVCSVKKLREPAERVRSLTSVEEASLLGQLNAFASRVTRLALLTGMRQGEVLALRKAAVDLEQGTLVLTDTKNGEPRTVYLNEEAAAVVRDALAASSCAHVFVSRTGKPYTSDGFRAVFRRASARAAVVDFRFHDTRHTTATRLRRADVGLDVVARALGHKSLRMTARYAHIEPTMMRASMARLPALQTPAAPPQVSPPVAKKRAS